MDRDLGKFVHGKLFLFISSYVGLCLHHRYPQSPEARRGHQLLHAVSGQELKLGPLHEQ